MNLDRPLAGRRVMLVGIGFYDYEAAIAAELRAFGAVVHSTTDMPPTLQGGWRTRLLSRIPPLARAIARRHHERLLRAASATAFDLVIVIKAQDLPMQLIEAVRARLSAATFVLYEWDSLARVPGIEAKLPLFHRKLTFDRHDALARPEFEFRPLFFRPIPPAPHRDRDIDVSFVGWLHSDRLAGVRAVEAQADAEGLTTFVYLYTGFWTWLRLRLKGQSRGVHWRTLPYERVADVARRSRCVLDLPHPAQTGLTMRAVESLGAGSKLATTARDIINYDFFDPANILVLDAAAPKIPTGFIRTPQVPVDAAVLARYSLDTWTRQVAGVSARSAAEADPLRGEALA